MKMNKRSLIALSLLLPVAADASSGTPPDEPRLASPWCAPAPDDLPLREMADRVYLCFGASASFMREIAALNRAMADVGADEDAAAAKRRLREASEHADATVRAVEAGCPSASEIAPLSPASRRQVAEMCERGDTRALGRVRDLLRLLGRDGPVPDATTQ